MTFPDTSSVDSYFALAGSIIAIVGGIIAGIYYISRLLRKKPKLNIPCEEKGWYKREGIPLGTDIDLLLRFENTGVTTTIKRIEGKIEYDGEEYLLEPQRTLNIELNPGAAIPTRFIFHLPIEDVVIDGEIEKATLTVVHTYGKKKIVVTNIPFIKST